MIEFITLTIITLVVISILRPGKTPPLNNPLVIERPGQYHMTLAPQLNLAQPLIEAIAKQIGISGDAAQNCATQYFEVRDKQVTAHGSDSYLLAITRRNGTLYFQACSPQAESSDFNTIAEFSSAVLTRFPATGEHDGDERIAAAAQEAARIRNITIKRLAPLNH